MPRATADPAAPDLRRSAAGDEHDAPTSTWSGLRLMVGNHEGRIVGLSATAVLSGFAEAGILGAIAQVAAALISGADSVHVSLGPLSLDPNIGTLLGIAGSLAIARIVLQAASAFQQASLAANVQAQSREELFAAFTGASWELQSSDREGHLQETLTSQILQATGGTLQLAGLVSSLLTFLVLVFSAMLLNVAVAAIVVLVAILLFAVLRPLSSLGRRSARELSRSQLNFAGGVGEAVRMAEETQVFGVGEAQRVRLSGMTEVARGLFLRTQFVGRLVPALFQSLIYLTVVAGLGVLYATKAGGVGSLGAVILMMVRAGSYGQQVQSSYQGVLQALPFVERIHEVTSSYRASRATHPERPLGEIATISFSDVSYAYRPGEPVLSDISFETARGRALGVVGPSGAGKSTLVQLLLRLREPTGGTYAINGIPAREFSRADWHRRIAYVPQKPQLLHASVADNIRYFREIDDRMVERAARLARIDQDILSWSSGFETIVGPRADSISGGQQQRICLARALAAAPEVLVLDEPTSALDPRSEALIQESLGEIARELTLFVVTHRMSMLAVCGSVLVIVDGRVDDFGSTSRVQETNEYLRAA
jgi:ATP-binding cassette, subfamily B, bacterial